MERIQHPKDLAFVSLLLTNSHLRAVQSNHTRNVACSASISMFGTMGIKIYSHAHRKHHVRSMHCNQSAMRPKRPSASSMSRHVGIRYIFKRVIDTVKAFNSNPRPGPNYGRGVPTIDVGEGGKLCCCMLQLQSHACQHAWPLCISTAAALAQLVTHPSL
jgi:hypothetical protein